MGFGTPFGKIEGAVSRHHRLYSSDEKKIPFLRSQEEKQFPEIVEKICRVNEELE